jgi:2,3-bisphosphoglycerate-independent phosphoglycerate mutase
MDVIEVEGANGLFDTNIEGKIEKTLEVIKNDYDFVFMHLKGTDTVAEEEGDWNKKIEFLERADKSMIKFLDFEGTLCVTGDHSTPCVLRDHSLDPVPLMIIGGGGDSVESFNEKECALGGLGFFSGHEIMGTLIRESENA